MYIYNIYIYITIASTHLGIHDYQIKTFSLIIFLVSEACKTTAFPEENTCVGNCYKSLWQLW